MQRQTNLTRSFQFSYPLHMATENTWSLDVGQVLAGRRELLRRFSYTDKKQFFWVRSCFSVKSDSVRDCTETSSIALEILRASLIPVHHCSSIIDLWSCHIEESVGSRDEKQLTSEEAAMFSHGLFSKKKRNHVMESLNCHHFPRDKKLEWWLRMET
jgi:hypothetical protein